MHVTINAESMDIKDQVIIDFSKHITINIKPIKRISHFQAPKKQKKKVGLWKTNHTSGDFSLALNLATRSEVVTGAFCNKTALISSSVTGPAVDADPAFADDDVTADDVDPAFADDGVPLGGTLPLEADALSSFTEDFESCPSKVQIKLQRKTNFFLTYLQLQRCKFMSFSNIQFLI